MKARIFETEREASDWLTSQGYIYDGHFIDDNVPADEQAWLQTTIWKNGELVASLQWDEPTKNATWRVEFGTVDNPPEG